jgi:hypothetical protein
MGQDSQELETVVSNEFLTDNEIFETIKSNNKALQTYEVETIKKDLHEFCVLILETFRDEKKNKY